MALRYFLLLGLDAVDEAPRILSRSIGGNRGAAISLLSFGRSHCCFVGVFLPVSTRFRPFAANDSLGENEGCRIEAVIVFAIGPALGRVGTVLAVLLSGTAGSICLLRLRDGIVRKQ